MLGRVAIIALGITIFAASLMAFCGVASAYYIGHQYALMEKVSGSQWDGIQVRMEVRAGELDYADAVDGLYIANSLWAYTDATGSNEFVEAGYTRGWNTLNIMTGYWASRRYSESQGQYVYAEHRIVNCTWTGGDWHYFKIMHHSGTTTGDCTWQVFVDGSAVQSGDGVGLTTSHQYPHSSFMQAGLEVIASSGKLGASSNNCRLYNLAATTDEQGSWGNFNNPTTTLYPGYNLWLGWQSYATDFKNYRKW